MFRVIVPWEAMSISVSPFIVSLIVTLSAVQAVAVDSNSIKVRVWPERVQQGDACLIQLIPDGPFTRVALRWRKEAFPFHREEACDSYSLLFGIDLDEPAGKKKCQIVIQTSQGKAHDTAINLEVTEKQFPTQYLVLPPEMVTLNSEILERVRREKKAVQRIWKSSGPTKLWKSRFMMPLDGEVLSPFGVRRIINKERRNPHTGIDLRAKLATPVLASNEGIVALTAEHFFAGKSVFLDHGMGVFTMYFHLSKIWVAEGDKVIRGQVIGLVGKTGRATGPHLHWGVRIKNSRVDPLSLLRLKLE
jgi:hypothetical protein